MHVKVEGAPMPYYVVNFFSVNFGSHSCLSQDTAYIMNLMSYFCMFDNVIENPKLHWGL